MARTGMRPPDGSGPQRQTAALGPGLARVGLLGAALLAAAPALADVFEVADDGALVARSGLAAGQVWDTGLPATVPDETGPDTVAPDVPSPALTLVGMPAAPAPFQADLLRAARRYDLSPALLAALVWQESRWQPGAVSSAGAVGLAQLMPATARALAVNPREPAASLDSAAHYLRQLLDLFDGDVERALAAYNAGPTRVMKAGGVPAISETRSYVSRIIDRLADVRPAVLATTMGAAR